MDPRAGAAGSRAAAGRWDAQGGEDGSPQHEGGEGGRTAAKNGAPPGSRDRGEAEHSPDAAAGGSLEGGLEVGEGAVEDALYQVITNALEVYPQLPGTKGGLGAWPLVLWNRNKIIGGASVGNLRTYTIYTDLRT